MNKTVEDRVVSMRFDNSQFEKNVRQSMDTIDNLEKSLQNLDSSKSLNDLSKAADKVDLSNITRQTEAVTVKFTAMQRIAQNAIDDLYRFARNKLTGLWGNTIGQIMTGGKSRAENIANAKFQLEGLKVNWDSIYSDINYGVKSTAYGLDAAARAASQLVASGVQFGEAFGETGNSPMAKALRGISGVAAMTNSSFEDISRVFTTVAGQGRLMGDQLNQLAARGLNVAATLGESLGKTEKEVRDMVSKGKIDFETFSRIMDEAFGEHAKEANKTFSGALSNMKAALSRVGADFWTPYEDNMKDVFNAITPLIDNFKKALAPVYSDVERILKIISTLLTRGLANANKLEAFQNIVMSVRNVLGSVVMILMTLREAFVEVFPPLKDSTAALKQITDYLVPSEKALSTLKSLFKVILTPLKVIIDLVKVAAKILALIIFTIAAVVKKLFESFDIITRLVDPLTSVVKQTNIFQLALNALYTVLTVIIGIFSRFVNGFVQFVTILKNSAVVSNFVNFIRDLGSIIVSLAGGALSVVVGLFNSLFSAFSNVPNVNWIDKLHFLLMLLGNAAIFAKDAIVKLVKVLATGIVLAAMAVFKIFKKLVSIFGSIGKSLVGLLGNFSKLKDELKGTKSFGEVIGVIFNFIGEAAKNFAERFQNAMQNLSAGKVITYAYAIAMIYLLKTFQRFLKAGTGLINSIGSIGTALTSVAGSFKGIVKVLDKRNMLLGFSLAMAVFTASIVALTLLDWNDILRASLILGSFIVVTSVLLATLSLINNAHPESIQAVADALTGLGIAMIAFSASAIMLQNLKVDDLGSYISGISTVIGFMAIMTLSIIALSKYSEKAKSSIFTMLGFALSLSIVMKAFKAAVSMGVSLGELGYLITILGAMAVVISLFAMIFKKVQYSSKGILNNGKLFSFTINAAYIGLGLVLLGLAFLVGQILKIGSIPEEAIKDSLLTLLAVLGEIFLFLLGAKKLLTNIVVGVAGMFGAISAMMISISIMAHALKNFELKELKTAAIVFIGIVAAIALLVAEMALLDKFVLKERNVEEGKKTESSIVDIGKTLKAIGKAMTSMVLAITVLILALALIPKDKFWRTVDTLKFILAEIGIFMIAAVGLMAFAKEGKKLTGSFITLSILFATIAGAMAVLTLIDSSELMSVAGALGIIMIGLALLIAVLSALKFDESSVKALTRLNVMVIALMSTLGILSFLMMFNDETNAVLIAMGSITIVLLALGAMFKLINNTKIDSSTLIWTTALIAVVGLMTVALAILAEWTSPATVLSAVGSVVVVLLTLGAAMKLINGVKVEQSVMLTMIGTIIAIGLMISLITAIATSGGSAIAAAVSLAIVMGVMAGVLVMLEDMKTPDVGSFVVMAIAMGILGAALSFFASMDISNIIAVSVAIGLLGLAIAGMTAIMTAIDGGKLMTVASALIIVIIGFSSLALVLGLLSSVGPEGIKTIQDLALTIGIFIAAMAGVIAILAVVLSFFPLSEGALLGFAAVIGAVGIAVLLFGVAFRIAAGSIASLLTTVSDIALANNDLDHLSKTFGVLAGGAAKLGASLLALSGGLLAFALAGVISLIGFAGMAIGLALVALGAVLAAGAITLLAGAIELLIGVLGTISMTIFGFGANIMEGLMNGLSSMFQPLVNLWNRIINFLPDSIKNLLGIHSPSTVFRWIGDNLMNGFLQGLIEKFPALESVLGGIADTCYELADRLEEEGDTWGNAITFGLDSMQGSLDNYKFDFSNILSQLGAVFGLEDLFGPKESAYDLIEDMSERGAYAQSQGHAHSYIHRWEAEGYESAEAWNAANTGIGGYLRKAQEALGIDMDLTSGISDLTGGMGDLTSGLGDLTSATDGASSSIDNLGNSVSSALDIFSEFNMQANKTSQDVLRNFLGQIEGVSKWSEELSALAGRGISQAVLEDLADMGPEGYENVHAMYTMTASELSLFNKMYAQKLSLERTTAASIRASFDRGESVLVSEASEVGDAIGTALYDGMTTGANTNEFMSEMERGVRDAGYDVIDGVVMTGREIPKEMELAIRNGTASVVNAFGNMGMQSIDAFKNYLSMEDAIYAVEDFQSALRDSVASSLSLFDEVTQKEDISAEQMIKNMSEQIKSVGKWASNLKILAERGISEGLLAELQALGPQGADKVAAFVKMSDAQLAKANSLYASSLELPDYVTDKLTKSYAQAGYQTTLGFTEGIDPSAAEAVMTALGTQSLDALKESLDIHSPSGKTMEAGMYAVMGLAMGVEDNLPMITEAGSKMGSSLVGAITFGVDAVNTFVSNLFGSISSVMLSKLEEFRNSDGVIALKKVIFDMLSDISNDVVIEPKIKPVIDMDGLKGTPWSDFATNFDISGTISKAYAATNKGGNTPDYSSYMRDITNNQSRIFSELQSMRNDISGLNSAMSSMQVQLDGASVGRVISPYVNQNLGRQYVNDSRRKV